MIVWVLISLFVMVVAPAGAQTPPQRANGDGTFRVKSDDAEMAAAIATARAGLDAFLARADRPAAGQRNFSVKVRVPHRDGAEFLWLRPFAREGDGLVGRVVNEPRRIADLKYGDLLSFKAKDIADWSYIDNGRTVGNFTGCVLIAREPPERRAALRARTGLDCEP